MASKYVDTTAIMQVIGCVFNTPQLLEFTDRYTIRSKQDADLDYLSGSDLECLDYAIDLCKNKSFSELTEFSHRLAWNKGRDNKDNSISFADMLLEMNDEEEYIAYVVSKMEMTEKLQML